MSRCLKARIASPTSFPRVSGDEPAVLQGIADFIVFSPRERG